MMKKFVVSRKGEVEKINHWFIYCKENQVPFITITKGNKYCTIRWDHISLDKSYDQILIQNRSYLLAAFKDVFDKFSSEKSSYEYNCMLLTFRKIRIEDSTKVGEQIFDTLYNLINKYKKEVGFM